MLKNNNIFHSNAEYSINHSHLKLSGPLKAHPSKSTPLGLVNFKFCDQILSAKQYQQSMHVILTAQ